MKKKKLIIIASIPIFIFLGIFSFAIYKYAMEEYFYDKYDLPKEAFITYSNKVNLFEDITYFDLITNKNVEILNEDEKIDTERTGRRTNTFDIKYNDKLYYYQMTVNVMDVTPPYVLSYFSTMTTKLFEPIYPCDNAVYLDDYDNKPTCTIDGDYNLTETGTYEVNYIFRDKAGNETIKPLKVNVVEKINSSKSNSSNYVTVPDYMDDIINKYKTDKTMIGIDVSKWQGNIDFEKVKNAGVEFVIIRIGVQAGKDYDYSLDGNYKTYIHDAKEAGLKVGVYVYSTALNFEDGIKCGKWVLDNLAGEKLDLGISYDWENYKWLMDYEVSIHELNGAYRGFSSVIKSAGYEPHFYASKNYLEKLWLEIDEPVWLAHYTEKTNYQGKYFMWQMSSVGKVDGIPDNYVDIDILYLD